MKGQMKRILSLVLTMLLISTMAFPTSCSTGDEKFDALTIFTDKSCSKLKKGISQKKIDAISSEVHRKLATQLLSGTYDNTGFRIQTYRPYQHPDVKAYENLTAPYSLRDNPTGIYAAKAGEPLYVFVGDTHGREMSLLIEGKRLTKDYPKEVTQQQKFDLIEGFNKIVPEREGVVYLLYHVKDHMALKPKNKDEQKAIDKLSVNINIMGGTVNGYYDVRKHTPKDWTRILAYESGAETLDLLGEKVHVSWVKDKYREFVQDPTGIMAQWDTILMLQHDFLGLNKYSLEGGLATGKKPNRVFENRIFLDVHPGNPGASSYKITFPHNTGYDELFVNVDRLKARLWGPAHEIGHMNQIRPGFNWGGMIETTNNIFCVYNQHVWGQMTRLTDDNYYGKAKEKIIDAYEADPTRMDLGFSGIKGDFEKVVPYWQLYLYMSVNGNEDYYKDIFEQYRVIRLDLPGVDPEMINSPKKDHGIVQTEFVKMACEAAQLDLREFFTKWGFLRVTDMHFNQYIDRHLVVTAERIKEVSDWIEAKNYPKPSVKIWEINDDNYKSYIDPVIK